MTALPAALVLAAFATVLVPTPVPASRRLRSLGAHSRQAPSRQIAPHRAVSMCAGLALAVLVVVVPGLPVPWWRMLLAALLGVTVPAALRRFAAGGRTRRAAAHPLRMAASWDLLAACLRSGMPVPAAVRAVAPDVPGPGGSALTRAADLVALGRDPVDAWAPALECPDTAALARVARRTARSGAAMAGGVAELARELRDSASDAAEARAQRASVLVSGPLGLCFLPAFLCVGVVPVVIGLAKGMLSSW